MAVFQETLKNTILKAKNYVGCLAGSLVKRANYGDDVSCGEMQMLLIIEYIHVAEFYYCLNYTEDGNVTTPDYTCLTYDQIQKVVANLNQLMK